MLRQEPHQNPQTSSPAVGPGSDLYRGMPHETGHLQVASFPVDIYEDDDEIVVEAELPGFSKDDIDVTIQDSVLCIAAERESTGGRRAPRLQERQRIAYQRRFTLPAMVDEDRIEAQLQDGVLTMHLGKSEERRPRRIDVL